MLGQLAHEMDVREGPQHTSLFKNILVVFFFVLLCKTDLFFIFTDFNYFEYYYYTFLWGKMVISQPLSSWVGETVHSLYRDLRPEGMEVVSHVQTIMRSCPFSLIWQIDCQIDLQASK